MFLEEQSSPTNSPRPQSAEPPATRSTFGLPLVLIVVASLLSGGIGGAAVTLWAGPYLRPILNSVLPPQSLTVEEESASTEVVKKVSPSVVSIIITKDLSQIYNLTGPQPFDNFFDFGSPFNFFFGQQPQQSPPQAPQGKQEIGGGTGFVINQEKGLILTNRHVVSDTEAEYTVLANDGRKFPATVVARDTVNDMALVQIQDTSLPEVKLGDSDSVQIGQTVIAIGNALGEYRNTVTKGVISGIGRNVVAGDSRGSSEQLEGVFQTDAAINPGNSGGPLVNLQGEVIGINTAVNSQGQLIGFALPINEAKRMIDSYNKNGRIVRPYLGIRYVIVTPELARANDLTVDYGALLARGETTQDLAVVSGSPADKAGLVENDIILEVEGQRISQEFSLVRALSRYNPGQIVKLKVYSKGETKDVAVTLEEFKE
ncbi:MAG: trypsin-like peptidase domain-containing protein [Candidatus Veblenbacteria bacterium]|nr:trypsin-like peptidase domain-containing protein [Candidatus Veblenbacteria bacterium]